MAFPTSGLSNNQVHKEGNRAFVYDSTLGTWDQVRETDRTENKILSGTIDAATTFPSGHVLQIVWAQTSTILSATTEGFKNLGLECQIVPTSTTNKILVQWIVQAHLYTNHSGFKVKLLGGAVGSESAIYESASTYAVYWNAASNFRGYHTWQELHTPATTAQVNYKIQVSIHSGNGRVDFQDANNRSYMQLTEIVA